MTVWGVLGEAGRVWGGVETLSGADMRELGLLRLIILGLRWLVLVSSPRARLLLGIVGVL